VKEDIGDILRELADLYTPMAGYYNITISVNSYHKQFPCLEIAPYSIRLAINNLLHNAIIFSLDRTLDESLKEPKQVTIIGKRAGRFYELAFTNLGIGIMPNEYDRVFEDGYQGIQAEKIHITGLGRGLYVAKAIVEGHHGRIRVQSKKVDKGFRNTFELLLPYRQPALQPNG